MSDNRNEFEQLREVQVSSEKVFGGHLLHVYKDAITLPNGKEASREYIRHQGAVAVVPLTENNEVYIVRQFRYPMNEVLTEIPAGKLDGPDEDHLEAAKRELSEETGVTADTWIDLGEYYPTPAYSSEVIYLYLAKGLHQGKQHTDEDEFLTAKTVPLKELIADVMKGLIPDGKTQTALIKADLYLRQAEEQA
ncbi:MAG: NUDIX hydrolase [Lachnospiraceae bacterium]|nr:NUDIX hydrolase [Lachnospiraceae bacterium]